MKLPREIWELSDENFGLWHVEEVGIENLGERILESYFDYEKFGRDLRMDYEYPDDDEDDDENE